MNSKSIYDVHVIGVGGYARSGKDTFVNIAKPILRKNGYFVVQLAFASKLKEEVQKMLNDNGFRTSIYDIEDNHAKELIRPLLVWWGCQRRYETYQGMYWVSKVNSQLEEIANQLLKHENSDAKKIVFLISDVRFGNEAEWIQKTRKGKVIHLKRYRVLIDYDNTWESGQIFKKVYDPPPNKEEEDNDPIVQSCSDFCIEWEDQKHLTMKEATENPELQKVVMDCLNNTGLFQLTG